MRPPVRETYSQKAGFALWLLSMLALLRPYRGWVVTLFLLGLVSNAANLILPDLIGQGINLYPTHHGLPDLLLRQFLSTTLLIGVLSSLQSVVQAVTSERVARDLRAELSEKVSRQNYAFLLERDPARLLTNFTSDIDNVKIFVSQVISGLLSSVVVLVGASILLLRLNFALGMAVLTIVPLIAVTFALMLRRVRPLFKKATAALDGLNQVIEKSIVGAALVRVLNSQKQENAKFSVANREARDVRLTIVKNFSMMIPAVTFLSNTGSLIILLLGGRFVLNSSMTLGDLAAFNSYLALLIFPIFVVGFMSNLIAQAQTSYGRVREVLDSPEPAPVSIVTEPITGRVRATSLHFSYGEKAVLKGIDLELQPGSRNAVVGPTAAGKTQLLMLLSGLLSPDSGSVVFDESYEPTQVTRQIATVFQESALFRGTIRENIAFSPQASPEAWEKALRTAELSDFLKQLPAGLETQVAERGTTLSGGQKQRITLARALLLEPKVLLLDDFTARLDPTTEARVRKNLVENYPEMTVLAVTQRIATIVDFDQISLMMEGRILAQGTHGELLEQSPEYAQIYESQKSTHQYE